MAQYFEKLNPFLKEYFEILSDEIPDFLNDYIATPVMQRQSEIGIVCGKNFSKMFDLMKYSNLDHSIAVSLIIWHFTKDKKQTLAGLFHDIATPAFKHTIDFMNGDYEKQETTEELTSKIITNSKEIMQLLERDNVLVKEVEDYHKYPIADNDIPKLSSDRLEYTFSNGFGATAKLWGLDEIKKVYKDIEILTNEEGMIELGFKSQDKAEMFVHTICTLSSLFIDAKTLFSMQLSEEEVIAKMENCKVGKIAEYVRKWENGAEILEGDYEVPDKYLVHIENVKIRYINPLVKISEKESIRVSKISERAKQDIEKALSFKTKKFLYMDEIG